MTDKRTLADTIARAIANQIESSRSIIVQNMADVIHDALLLDKAKQEGNRQINEAAKGIVFDRNFEAEMREIGETMTSTIGPEEPHPSVRPHPFRKISAPEPHWGSLKNWWQDEVDDWGSLKNWNWWQDEVDDYEKRRGGEPWAI